MPGREVMVSTRQMVVLIKKMVRKPEGVGCELKSAADGMSGIILKLELMEGSEAQSKKPGHAEYGEGTSQLLRLCAP